MNKKFTIKKNIVINISLFLLNFTLLFYIVNSVIFFNNTNKKKIYNQNIDEIFNINQSAEKISSNYFFSTSTQLEHLANHVKNKDLDLNGLFYLLHDFMSVQNCCFEVLDKSFNGYALCNSHEYKLEPISYANGYGSLCANLKECFNGEAIIRMSPEFTDYITALKSFSFYTRIYLRDENNELQTYILMMVSNTKSFLNSIEINSGYEKLATTIINNSGEYIIGNQDFKSNNFYNFLKIFNNLTLDNIKLLEAEVYSNQKGVLTFLDGRKENCVFVYTPIENHDWFCITKVPINSFRNISSDLSFINFIILGMTLAFAFDVYYLFLLNRKLKISAENEHTASLAKTDFLSRMSHDMRTPMNGILGLAELSIEEQRVDILHYNIKRIQESGNYLLSLINDTLDFQRIESGRMILEKKVENYQTIIDSIIDIVKPSIDKKNIIFNVINKNSEQNCNKYVLIDSVRFKQIIVNLLSNAIKFTPSGGTITFSYVSNLFSEMTSHEIIQISDTGLGMSKNFIEKKIFKPFSQETNLVSTQYAGSGLGLSIVKKIVEMMGGKIVVQSELGKGTTFTIYFDLEYVKNNEVLFIKENQKKQQGNAKEQLNGKNIMLVEDHPLNAEIASRLLEKVGCKITWLDNGQKALTKFMTSPVNSFDAILMDIRMPVMDGLTATKEIRNLEREDAKKIPIIAMTANAFDEDEKKCFEAGMNGHLGKPIVISKLYDTLLKNIIK